MTLHLNRHYLTVLGYIKRNINNYLLIPEYILQMIGMFYIQKDKCIVLCCGSFEAKNIEYNGIKIYNLDTSTLYNINVINTETMKKNYCNNIKWDKYWQNTCIISNLRQYPKFISKQERNKININASDVVILTRIAGNLAHNNDVVTQGDSILFNKHKLHSKSKKNSNIDVDGYALKFPDFPVKISDSACIYNENTNKIYSFGGRFDETDSDSIFSMNVLSDTQWNKHYKTLKYSRYKPGKCIINDNNIIICGGYGSKRGYLKECEIFNENDNENTCIQIGSLNLQRWYPTCLYLSKSNKVLCGGGLSPHESVKIICKRSIEMYDINKNSWELLKYKTIFDHQHPILFTDKNCDDVIYICGNEYPKKGLIGYIERIDLRENKPKWKSFKFLNKSLDKYFNINNNKNEWRGRDWITL